MNILDEILTFPIMFFHFGNGAVWGFIYTRQGRYYDFLQSLQLENSENYSIEFKNKFKGFYYTSKILNVHIVEYGISTLCWVVIIKIIGDVL